MFFKPLLLEDDGTWWSRGMMYTACDVLCSRRQDVTVVAVTVLASGGGWNKGFVTSAPSHTVHKKAAGMPCELFWSQECRQRPEAVLGIVMACASCRVSSGAVLFTLQDAKSLWSTSCPQHWNSGGLPSSVNSKDSILGPHHLKLDFTVNLESRVTFCPPCLGSLAYSLYKIVLFF